MEQREDVCRNCGAILSGAFCAACGQSVHDGEPHTIGHFFHNLIYEFVHIHADGGIFRTLRALFFQPGKLTEQYRAGRVASWIRPIRLFLIIAALQLLVSKGVGPMNYQVYLERAPAGDLKVSISNGARAREKTGYAPVAETERREFFDKFEKAYTEIRYSSVLIFALASWLFYRGQQPYFVTHLIGGLHFYSFWFAVATLVSLPARLNPLWYEASLLSVVYLYFALGRLFHEHWLLRLVKTTALFAIVVITELGLGFAAVRWAQR